MDTGAFRALIEARVEAMRRPAAKRARNAPVSSQEHDIDVYLKKAGYKGWSTREESR